MKPSRFGLLAIGVLLTAGLGCTREEPVRYVPGCAGLVALEEHSGVVSYAELRLCREQTFHVFIPSEGRMVEQADTADDGNVFASATLGWESDSPNGVSRHLGQYGIRGELGTFRLIRADGTEDRARSMHWGASKSVSFSEVPEQPPLVGLAMGGLTIDLTKACAEDDESLDVQRLGLPLCDSRTRANIAGFRNRLSERVEAQRQLLEELQRGPR